MKRKIGIESSEYFGYAENIGSRADLIMFLGNLPEYIFDVYIEDINISSLAKYENVSLKLVR